MFFSFSFQTLHHTIWGVLFISFLSQKQRNRNNSQQISKTKQKTNQTKKREPKHDMLQALFQKEEKESEKSLL